MYISATDLKNNLGQYLEASIKEPIIVEKNHRPASVVISYAEFQRYQELEDKLWGLRAMEAEKDGFLGFEESAKLLKELMGKKADEEK